MAAASFDDVLAISGFGLCLAFAVAHEEDLVSTEAEDDVTRVELAWLIVKAPLELVLGAAAGALGGWLLTLRTELTASLKREHTGEVSESPKPS